MRFIDIIYVFIGGGAGSVLRYLASVAWRSMATRPAFAGMVMPWPTLAVNVAGCVLIALFYSMSGRWGISPGARLLLTTGLCGGLTTFSTFSYETITLYTGGHYWTAAIYLLLSLVLGLAALFITLRVL